MASRSGSRAAPLAADPDSPGRTAPQVPLHRGIQEGETRPLARIAEEITRPPEGAPGGSAAELEAEAMQLYQSGNIRGAAALVTTAASRAAGKYKRELRQVADRMTWLLLWMEQATVRQQRAQLEAERERIIAQLNALDART